MAVAGMMCRVTFSPGGPDGVAGRMEVEQP